MPSADSDARRSLSAVGDSIMADMSTTRWAGVSFIGLTLAACAQSTAPSASEPSATAVMRSPRLTASAAPAASATVIPSSGAPEAGFDWMQASSATSSATVLDMAYGDDGFIAIGTDRDESRSGNPLFGRTWISGDGTNWELLPADSIFDRAYLTDVVATPDGAYVVIGRIEDASGSRDEVRLAMWESSDGRRWERLDAGPLSGLQSAQVAAGAKGYLLHAVSAAAVHQLWHSLDGRNWETVRELPPITVTRYEDIQRIAAGDDGFVAVGLREATRYVIASADGREWFEGSSNPDFSLLFAAVGGDWVMAGYLTEPGVLPMLFSTNGLDWERTAGVDIPSSEVIGANGLVTTGRTVFIGLAAPGAHPGMVPAGVWSSHDGITWTEVAIAADVYLPAAATSGVAQVLAGNLSGGGAVFFVRSEGE